MLRAAPRPDPQFADDLEAILASVDDGPADRWEEPAPTDRCGAPWERPLSG
jgi:hypothetical protein